MIEFESIYQFRIRLDNGKVITLTQSEAEQLRDYLNRYVPRGPTNPTIKPSSLPIESCIDKNEEQEEFKLVFSETTVVKQGIPSLSYEFLQNDVGEWQVEVKKDKEVLERLNIGKASDRDSPLAKTIIGIPQYPNTFNAKWLRREKILTNPRRIKACLHILMNDNLILKAVDPTPNTQSHQVDYVISPEGENLRSVLLNKLPRKNNEVDITND